MSTAMNFDFFDQFKTVEIDLSEYLKKYSLYSEDFKFSNLQPALTTMKDFSSIWKAEYNIERNINNFRLYEISDGEKVESISFDKYGTTEFWWLIYTVNDITDPLNQWPLSQEQLNEQVEKIYAEEAQYSKETYHKLLFEINESKRDIFLPTASALYEIIALYRKKILNG